MSLAARQSANADIRQGSFRIEPDELAALGLPAPRAFAVPANTLIVADTYGFHARGPSAGRSVRVEVWAYGRRSPFIPWTSFDPWSGAALAVDVESGEVHQVIPDHPRLRGENAC